MPRATGGARPDSDADIAVVVDEPLDLLTEATLAGRLARALDVPAVDLVDLGRAPLRSTSSPPSVPTETRSCAGSPRAAASMVDLDRIHQRLELLAGYGTDLRRLRDLPGLPDLDACAAAMARLAASSR